MSDSSVRTVPVLRDGVAVDDVVAIEEPLEIRVGLQRPRGRIQQSVSVTMRTPGADAELAVGFLVGEGLLRRRDDVREVRHCGTPAEGGAINPNVIRVELQDGVEIDLQRLQRNFYTTSSCGVCGKSSLEALSVTGGRPMTADWTMEESTLRTLPDRLRHHQHVFQQTGGLHAAAIFSAGGELIDVREDVGRHNALDKLVGAAFLEDRFPMQDRCLLLSGRASFELLQKALIARVPIVAAVGAPSSLAVELASEFGITLVGFLRADRYNVYTGPERIERS